MNTAVKNENAKVEVDWKVDEIGMVRQSISDMRDSEHPIFNMMVRQHNQKIHDFRQGKV